MSNKQYQVGQSLYWTHYERRQGEPHEVTITRVGRKWLELSNRKRVDRETLIEGGGAPGRCYSSKAEHDAMVERIRSWHSLRSRMSDCFRPPNGVSAETIRQAERLLFPDN